MALPAPDPILRWSTAPQSGDGGRVGGHLWLQGTGVAVDGQGIAILGASGSGKSSLALALMALGAVLVADDGLWLAPGAEPPRLIRPKQAPDLIEARGIGLIHAGCPLAEAPLALVVDLDRPETERLPPSRGVAIGDTICPLILGAGNPSLAPALTLLVRHGRAPV